MRKDKTQFSLVIELPYSFSSTKTIWDAFKVILENTSEFPSVRVRIWPKKAVSSLSVYESVHSYCPSSATIVASRFNIYFHGNFI